ncbi:MAG TPA: L,D-transpeptidase [Thermomicrobiaceae bacterium]|nr:L,D-transpeptidase [Thermomicrobiaceae bacterium]
MRARAGLVLALVVALSALLLSVPSAAAASSGPGPDRVYFPQTGHYLAYGFLDYWRGHGDISTFGYPISEEFQQNGVTVQYFERAVFEFHPNAPAGWNVQLRRLGADQTATLAATAPFVAHNGVSDAGCDFYAQTGHDLCNGFRDYWNAHGGLAIFGYPISDEFQQNGMTVQYFERARFEYHPSNPPGSQVELGLLGDAAAAQDHVSTTAVPRSSTVSNYDPSLWAPPGPADVTTPPPGAPTDQAKWIEVDLTNQYLRAWQYSTRVYGEYVSTGVPAHPTPTGTFHIFEKLPYDDMTGGLAGTSDYYYLPNVPNVMYFLDGGYAIHGTYWHHNFGHVMSHGCVNMTLSGAAWIYNWAPVGTTVWIHY